jgi:two-component system phosphate regulon response regulator PhoB
VARRGKPTILVADDSAPLRTLFSVVLQKEGYRVLEAPDGPRTVRTLLEEHVDALFLDVRFGLEDGIALAKELRLDWPDLPIALVTGDSSTAEATRRAGGFADLILPKPLTLTEIAAAASTLLRRRL